METRSNHGYALSSRLFHSPIPRVTAVALVALGALSWSGTAILAPAQQKEDRNVVDSRTIDSMIRAHLLDYFGDKSVRQDLLGIATVDGSPFHSLAHTFSIESGGVELRGGNIVPKVGALVTFEFGLPITVSGTSTVGPRMITVSGNYNGNDGIKTIRSVHVVDGTRIQLKAGGTYILKDGRWTRNNG
jgi:hypothetical protein